MRYIVTRIIYLSYDLEADSEAHAEDKFDDILSKMPQNELVDFIFDAQHETEVQDNN